jgi:hypothetical protein
MLDRKLERLVFEYTQQLELAADVSQQMIKEIKICADRGYNTRAELISLVKNAMQVGA